VEEVKEEETMMEEAMVEEEPIIKIEPMTVEVSRKLKEEFFMKMEVMFIVLFIGNGN